MPSLAHPFNPQTFGIRLSTGLRKNSSGTVDHEGAQISISALTDPEQAGLASTGSLFGDEPNPQVNSGEGV